MHISITGDLGSGKSSVAKLICAKLNYKYLSTGQIQRQLGQTMGMNTLEFNKYTDNNKEIDDYIDQYLKDINHSNESHVLDSRLAWFFVNKSFKVYLLAADEVAAQRVLKDNERIGEPEAKDIAAKIADQKKRREIESNRFNENYGIVSHVFSDFDIIVDTSSATISEVSDLIISSYEKWKSMEKFTKIWLSPLRIYPTEDIRNIAKPNIKIVLDDISKNGFNETYPISVALYNKDFFIFDGHKRCSASIFNKFSFVPVSIIAKDLGEVLPAVSATEFVKESLSLSRLYDWEDAHAFRFFHYPRII